MMNYAKIWRRYCSYCVDILLIKALLVGIPSMYFPELDFGEEWMFFLLVSWFILGLFIVLWFHIYFVASFGGTPGKLCMQIKIAMLDGSPITKKAAALRYAPSFVLMVFVAIALLISTWQQPDLEYFYSLSGAEKLKEPGGIAYGFACFFSLLMAIFTCVGFVTMLCNKKRRAALDFIAGTVVIKKDVPIFAWNLNR